MILPKDLKLPNRFNPPVEQKIGRNLPQLSLHLVVASQHRHH